MATRYEYYNTGDDDNYPFYGAYWKGQTFTPSVAHKITSVKLLLYRFGSPGTITVSIRATDEGEPIGADLCSGSFNGNDLTDVSPGEWREITLGDGYNLEASTQYAIVVRATNGDSSNCGYWRLDYSSPTYAGGTWVSSENSGVGWAGNENADYMFEEWGGVEVPTVTTNPATNITSVAARLNGTVADAGGEACEYRFRYKVSGGSYTNTTWAGSVETDATFYEDITSLTAGATYYFNAQLKNTAGESAWGDEESFTTMKVATNPATHIEATTARLNGTVTSEGGEACQYRFRYREALTSDSYTNTTWTGSKETGETFYEDITSLTEDTSYEFAAQIKNTAGESDWGTTLYFKTGTHSYTMPPVFDDHGRIPKGARVQARRADTGVVVETRYLGVDGQATFTDLPNDTGITFLTQWGGTTHCSQLVHSTIIGVAEGGTGASDASTARTNLGVGTGDSPQFTAVNVGHASDTTLTRVSAALIAVEGDNLIRASDVDDTPVNGQTAVPISSNWAFDHNAAVLSHLVHNNDNIFLGYGNEGVVDPTPTTLIKIPTMTAIADPASGLDVSDWYGALGAYRQADADSDATHIQDDDASFPNSIYTTLVKWASNAAGTTNTGIGAITAVDSDTLTLIKFTGDNFAASYYYWIKHSEWVAPVTGYYLSKAAVLFLPAEADKIFKALIYAYSGTDAPVQKLDGMAIPALANYIYAVAMGTLLLTAGDHVFSVSNHMGTSGTPDICATWITALPFELFLLKQTA